MKISVQFGRRAVLVVASCVLVLVAGGSKSQTTPLRSAQTTVEYQGDVLVVSGIRYPKESTASEYKRGEILIVVQAGNTESVAASLLRLGLSSTLHGSSEAGYFFVVVVPNGFETQWVAALRVVPGVSSTHLDHIVRPA